MMFGAVFRMLAGYVIEAMVKGILVARHRGALTEGHLPTWLTHHKLEDLLKRAGVALEAEHVAFVRRATVAVIWAGRYPVPKDASEQGSMTSSSSDLETFQEIYERLSIILEIESLVGDKPRKGIRMTASTAREALKRENEETL